MEKKIVYKYQQMGFMFGKVELSDCEKKNEWWNIRV